VGGQVLHGFRGFDPAPGRVRARPAVQAAAALCALSLVGLAAAGCGPADGPTASGPFLVSTHPPAWSVSILAGRASAVAAVAARKLFASAPVVVVGSGGSGKGGGRRDLAAAAAQARRVHGPLLLAWQTSAGAVSVTRLVRTEIKALHPRAVLAVGLPASALAAALPGLPVVGSGVRLPKTTPPVPLTKVALLVHRDDAGAGASAVIATARAAGADVVFVRGFDPRADRAAITELAAAKPTRIVALGARFGPAGRLAARVAVAETGVQLPGGGQVLFPMHRLVALYGNPTSPALGALGEQDLTASIARVKHLAALYRPLSKVPVVPAFEIIATVAQGLDQPEGGTYSYVTPLAELRSWVTMANRAGLYVILDLQAGRASLLAQAKYYRPLLERPDVGLAIDPEWKLGPGQLPLEQIGSVTSQQVNVVAKWLAALTARYHLPQKLLVLHQFRLTMIGDEQALDTRFDDLAIVIHMDGQGTPADKEQTWDAVLGAAPPHVFFGWKNFFVKDHPMLTPWQTMNRTPQPVMISYQ
jgi:hypothetical protein